MTPEEIKIKQKIQLLLEQLSPEERYTFLYEETACLCEGQEWGDPFSYARSKEIYAAIKLGHTVASKLAGADAYDARGRELEYKSTIGKNCTGTYTGISVQPSWSEQVAYLREDKIAKYPEHYYNRFEAGTGVLAESYMIPGETVLELLLPKLEKAYPTVLDKKDPRLSANITWSEIKKHGTKVI